MNWRIISAYVPYLSDEFRAAEKDLDIAIYGTFVQQERWKTCVRMTDSVIGFATGSLFVKKRFPGESKKKVILISVVNRVHQEDGSLCQTTRNHTFCRAFKASL